ncbi:MAG: gluconate 2-dehydrogenase subunit 3 family protein [Cyclobacteriaceae bacterium]|nr:gluconate 2-dehydrogenase subunit 3 family protein [Cyclobacteriaceae bacterium]
MKRRDILKKTTLGIGAAMTAPILPALIQGCNNPNSAITSTASWVPEALSTEQGNLLIHFIDVIIPTNDTPSASETDTHHFIDFVVKDVMEEGEARQFISGIDQMEKDCINKHNKSFTLCDTETKVAVMASAKDSSFFKSLRSLTYRGYFSSEQGRTQNYQYTPIPGKYEPCMEMTENKRIVGNQI